MGVVYCLTSPSGRQYVGYTLRDVSCRLAEHCSSSSRSAITNAIKKYGIESFRVEILLESSDREILAAREVEEISKRNSLQPNGYNLTLGGDGCNGLPASARVEMGNKIREKWKDTNYRSKRKHSLTKFWSDSNVREKQKAALKHYYADPSNREAARLRTRTALANPENRSKHRAALKAAWSSESLRKANSLRCAALWSDPAVRKARSYAYKAKFAEGTTERERLRNQAREAAVPVMIENVLYRSVPDAAEELKLSNAQVEYRCSAAAEKWKTWFKVRSQ